MLIGNEKLDGKQVGTWKTLYKVSSSFVIYTLNSA